MGGEAGSKVYRKQHNPPSWNPCYLVLPTGGTHGFFMDYASRAALNLHLSRRSERLNNILQYQFTFGAIGNVTMSTISASLGWSTVGSSFPSVLWGRW